MFCKKDVLRNFAKFTGNTWARVSFLMKLQTWDLQLYQKETLAQVFSCEFSEISKNAFSSRTPPVTASDNNIGNNSRNWNSGILLYVLTNNTEVRANISLWHHCSFFQNCWSNVEMFFSFLSNKYFRCTISLFSSLAKVTEKIIEKKTKESVLNDCNRTRNRTSNKTLLTWITQNNFI